MPYFWGPHYLVPSKAISNYSGCVLLREKFDEELLRKQLDERGHSGSVIRVTNGWFFRKKNSEKWIRIGESGDIIRNFPVIWDTTNLENGQYEILGFMQAFIGKNYPTKWEEITLANGKYEKFGYRPIYKKRHVERRVIGDQNIVEVNVMN
jgi:hypothetical protein